MSTHLPLLTTRIRSKNDGDEESALARQWRLLKLLTFAPKGFTVKQLVAVSGMSVKTIRRDLVFLKEVGFDVAETVGESGVSRGVFAAWRITGEGRGEKSTALIHDTLNDLHDVALILGDEGLAFSLKRLGEWVGGKCHGRKPKPR